MMDYEKTGRLIQEARKEKKLTQMQLAEILGVTDRAVSKWETGKSFPDISLLKPIGNALGLTVSEIIDGSRKPAEEEAVLPETEETVIRGIKTYIKRTEKKERTKLWIVMAAVLIVILGIGAYKLNEYNHRPIDFKEDNLTFGDMVYYVPAREESKNDREARNAAVASGHAKAKAGVYVFKLDDATGKEVREQIINYLRSDDTNMSLSEYYGEYPPEEWEKYPHVELEGLITVYNGGYYDHRSGKYYSSQHSGLNHRQLIGFCEDLLADEDYRYEGETHFKVEDRDLYVSCELTEKPMELIIDYYREIIKNSDKADYTIESIRRMEPDEYEAVLEFEPLRREIPYSYIYEYRVYDVEVSWDYIEDEKMIGTQFWEGTYHFLFMPAKSLYGDFYHLREEYVNMFFPENN